MTLRPAVADLLRAAGEQLVLPRFKKLQASDIMTKTSVTDLVTIVDHEAEAWLTPRLAALILAGNWRRSGVDIQT